MFSETQSLMYSYFMDFPFISRNFALFSENYATVGCEISRNTKVNFLAKFRIAKFRIHPIFGSDQYKVETGSLWSDTALNSKCSRFMAKIARSENPEFTVLDGFL
jgi:hypothetical protein